MHVKMMSIFHMILKDSLELAECSPNWQSFRFVSPTRKKSYILIYFLALLNEFDKFICLLRHTRVLQDQ